MPSDLLNVTASLSLQSGTACYVSLAKLAERTGAVVARLPRTVKILLENIARSGGDPKRVNPFIPVDLVSDHSVQVDRFGILEMVLRQLFADAKQARSEPCAQA